ncbi:hypothetical protein [Sphingosinicella sp. BN140058]|uniref:hypothetical protein n=1 Tax=Sphingosinicella sp. BN140058 TaxID=1892855 RepID=UPI0010131880|nr:hypothetical protein [Sphingosinicella sp. BN140058]QAY75874.1 hypothetical protein ETR14_04510 [Sphingosinicella sp. BN140058]
MKAAAFTMALLLSGAALAQTNGTDTSATTNADTSWQTGATAADAAPTGDMSMQTAPMETSVAAAGQMVEPHNANPERDARGIRVISAAAMVPAGYNGTSTGTAMGGPLLDPATGQTVGDQQSYPACSSAVTDKCVQTYERGRKS